MLRQKLEEYMLMQKYPVEFIYQNLQIQNNIIYASLKYNVKDLLFLDLVAYIQNIVNNQ